MSGSPNPSVYGQSVTFTAIVTATLPGIGVPTGTVQFSIDGSPVGSPVTLDGAGHATFDTSSLPSYLTAGSHTILASYSGGSNDYASSNSTSQVVNQASTTTTVSGADQLGPRSVGGLHCDGCRGSARCRHSDGERAVLDRRNALPGVGARRSRPSELQHLNPHGRLALDHGRVLGRQQRLRE